MGELGSRDMKKHVFASSASCQCLYIAKFGKLIDNR